MVGFDALQRMNTDNKTDLYLRADDGRNLLRSHLLTTSLYLKLIGGRNRDYRKVLLEAAILRTLNLDASCSPLQCARTNKMPYCSHLCPKNIAHNSRSLLS